jgi:hypothetical protein
MSDPERTDTIEIFHTVGCGWGSVSLGLSEGTGPYLSLPEALRRAEQIIGESVWKPSGEGRIKGTRLKR